MKYRGGGWKVKRPDIVNRSMVATKIKNKRPHPYGPVTSELTPLQQRFVEIMMRNPGVGQAEALRMAGHKGNVKAVEKMAYRLMRNPQVLAAMREGAAAALSGMVPRVIKALDDIIKDPSDRNHFKAIDGILNRAGLHEIKETKTTVTHSVNRDELIAKIRSMSERLGIVFDLDRLIAKPNEQVLLETH